SLIWAHSYRDPPPATAQDNAPPAPLGDLLRSSWKVSAPVVQAGRVVFTAPDMATIRCLSLRDGALLWKADRQGSDLSLAGVFDGKVLLVGTDGCRALRLTDGASLWQAPLTTPSGQGVASGSHYYLPLQNGDVCTIDLASGTIRATARSRHGEA